MKWVTLRTVYSFRNLLQHRAICKSDGVAVEIDRAIIGKAADRAVTGQIPSASGIDRNNSIVGDSSTTIGIIDNVDRSVKGAVIRWCTGTI